MVLARATAWESRKPPGLLPGARSGLHLSGLFGFLYATTTATLFPGRLAPRWSFAMYLSADGFRSRPGARLDDE